MNVVRTINRFVARWGTTTEPTAQEVAVYLIESAGRYYVKTPWAMIDAHNGRDTTDAQMAATLRPCFATEAEAVQWAQWQAPHWHNRHNDAIRCRLLDAIEWFGEFSGPERMADAVGVDSDYLRKLARGEKSATAKQAKAARDWKGGKVAI